MKPSDLGLPAKFTEFRMRQLETAAKINASSKYAYLLDAPTGIGKSLIAATVQRLLKKNICYVCTTKQLQDQLIHDFPYAKTVKGRSNYVCLKYPKMFPGVSAEECNHTEQKPCPEHNSCPYIMAKRAARGAPIAVLNTAYYLNEVNYVGMFDDYDLLVLDECLPYKARVLLEDGTTEYIGKIVNSKMKVRVLSYNEDTCSVEPRKVVNWSRKLVSEKTVEVKIMQKNHTSILRCTAGHEVRSVRGWIGAAKLNVGELVYTSYGNPKVPSKALSMAIGSLLGDGSIIKTKNLAYLVMVQKSKEYLEYKTGLLKPIFIGKAYPAPNWYGRMSLWRNHSTATQEFKDLSSSSSGKEVNDLILGKADALALSIFYMDDGNSGHREYSANFAVQSFSADSVDCILRWLLKEWAIVGDKRDEKGWVIHLNKENSIKLYSVIAKYVHPCMQYKLPEEYRGMFSQPVIQWSDDVYSRVISVEEKPFLKESSRSTSESYCYDLTIEGNHNFYANGVLVHNCDTLEDQLMSFTELTITQRQLQRLDVPPPRYKTKFESWVEWATATLSATSRDLAALEALSANKDTWSTEDVTLIRRKRDLSRLVSKLRFFVSEVDKNWIWYPGEDRWSFKPVWVSKYSTNALWKHAKKVLGMSATILDPRQVSVNTGLLLENRKYDYIQMPSPFPKEHRPVLYEPCADVTNRYMDTALPMLAKAVQKILDKHPDDHILIHTVSYKIRDYLMKKVASKRFVTHSTSDRTTVLENFKKSQKPLVLLSPSMDRGVDLPEEECRVVVIAKMPYPDLGDNQITRRVHASKDGDNWYAHKTVSKIIQMSGRAVRSEADYATTYIIDSQFKRIYDEHRDMFPRWWLEALVM